MYKRFFQLVVLLLASCTNAASLPKETPTPIPAQEIDPTMRKIRYLALGDSYTIGESVDESERWSNQLSDLIQSSPQFTQATGGTEGGIEVTVIARTGWTTDELWAGIQAREVNPPYDLVSLLIGVNNQYRGRDLKEYREQFIFLLNKAIEYAGGDPNRVIVLSIPDWGVTPFAKGRDPAQIAQEIDAFNSAKKEESEKANAHYVYITPISREAANDLSLIASDGLHPSGKMYAEWAKLALPVALEILK